ncbi:MULTISPECIES: TDT family transporter [Bacteria]|uniref:C4-dicarboxylate ABC transporter n=1 Tax=Muribaculaceae bacterium Z82 TaxID=2304548 RepID=A0A7C9NL56_9BACT
MDSIIKKLPIPAAGVALGLAALGNLLAPYGEVVRILCGALSLSLVGLLAAKLVLYPSLIRKDMENSIFASVSATFFMALMQLAGYLAPAAQVPAFALWCAAVVGHLALMTWFSVRFIGRFKLAEVFPTYFICYVGIIVASVTSPIFGMQDLGRVLFWFGFACYAVLFAVITLRYVKHSIPEPARPLFCIYAAPMSLSIAGYLSVTADPNLVFLTVLAVLAQVLFAVVLTQLPKFVAGGFYPSFAAMTFPFVITATALGMVLDAMAAAGVALPLAEALRVLAGAETLFAAAMVFFVLGHYVRFLASALKPAPAPAAEPAIEVLPAE